MPLKEDAMNPDLPDAEDVLQVRRLEIVDRDGRVRAVLGDVGPGGTAGPGFGLALLDPQGQHRVWLTISPQGPALAFDAGGNVLAELGVHDETSDALHIGAYLVFSDRSGALALGWSVEEDGSVSMRRGAVVGDLT